MQTQTKPTNTTPKIIKLFDLHPGQQKLLNLIEEPDTRYLTANIGRQWGKTTFAIGYLLFKTMSGAGATGVWISRWWKQTAKVFKKMCQILEGCPLVKSVNKSEMFIEFMNGSVIKFYSAHNPDNIRGETIDILIADEFSLYPASVWDEVLRPTLITRPKAKAVLISTPKGRGTWYNLFQLAYDTENISWKNYTGKTEESPFITKKDLEDSRKTMPGKIYKQEYEAEFIADDGALFENIDKCLVITPAKMTEHNYAGLDVAFKSDYTVLTIFNSNMEMLECLRFNDETLNFKAAADRIYETLKKYNFPYLLVETNRFDSVYTYLKEKKYPRLYSFETNHSNKNRIIEDLINLFQNQQIKLLDDTYIKSEFYSYEYTYNAKTRNITYNAPSGLHDDIVMSTALSGEMKTLHRKNRIHL